MYGVFCSEHNIHSDDSCPECEVETIALDEAYEKINEYIEDPGPYSHNIVGLILSEVGREHGLASANKIVEDLMLEEAFGICPVPE